MRYFSPFSLALIYLVLNAATFITYAWDKRSAAGNTWRVRENTLLWLAFVGGSLGAVGAQQILRHKTRKEPFRTHLERIVILHLGLLAIWLFVPG